MKKKAMFIAVSLVVSAPIVVGAYFLALRRYALEKPIAASQESGFLARQTSNSTAESAYKAPAATTTLPDLAAKKYWQVYINTQGEYEIRYPPTARLSASGAKTQIEFAQPFSTAANKGLDALTFNIRVQETRKSATAQEWALSEWGDTEFIHEQGAMSINGMEGYGLRIFQFDQESQYIYIRKRDKVYQIDFVDPKTIAEFPEPIRRQYDGLFREMLSTFRLR